MLKSFVSSQQRLSQEQLLSLKNLQKALTNNEWGAILQSFCDCYKKGLFSADKDLEAIYNQCQMNQKIALYYSIIATFLIPVLLENQTTLITLPCFLLMLFLISHKCISEDCLWKVVSNKDKILEMINNNLPSNHEKLH